MRGRVFRLNATGIRHDGTMRQAIMTTVVPVRVGVVDDHPVVRKGLRTFLEASPVIHIAFEAATGEEALVMRSFCQTHQNRVY